MQNKTNDFWSTQIDVYIDDAHFENKPQSYEMQAIRARQKGAMSMLTPLKDYLTAIENGQTIVPANLNGGTSNADWCSQELFLVDIDNVGMIITPDDALEICNKHDIHPFEMHYTFSHKDEHPKYRIGFLLEEGTEDENARSLIIQTLISLFPTSDTACKDASRLFYGSRKGSVFYKDEATFTLSDIYRISGEQNIKLNKSVKAEKTYGTFSAKSDLQTLLNKFPFEDWLADNYPEYNKETHKLKDCPICGHKDCFSYDPKTNRVTCFSANGNQGKSSSFIDFLVEAEGMTKSDAFNEFYNLCGVPNPHKLSKKDTEKQDDCVDIQTMNRDQYFQKYNSCNPLYNLWDDILKRKTPIPLPTGFEVLDEMLEGGLRTGLTIFGAMSSIGKTTFLLQMADNIANSGQDVLMISLEQTAYELLGKSLSRSTFAMSEGDFDLAKTQYGVMDSRRYDKYSNKEKSLLEKAVLRQMATGKHFYIYEGHFDTSIYCIEEVISKHIEVTGNKPIVILDYLQLIAPRSDRMTDTQAVKDSVFCLTKIAREHQIPICVISAFNRTSYKGEATMSSCRDTSSIEYTADIFLALQFRTCGEKGFVESDAKADSNDVRVPREVEVKILKNRGGKTGIKVPYDYYPAFNYFQEMHNSETTDFSKYQENTSMTKEEFEAYKEQSEEEYETNWDDMQLQYKEEQE